MLFDDEKRNPALVNKQKRAYILSDPEALYSAYATLLRQVERSKASANQARVLGAELDKIKLHDKKLVAAIDEQIRRNKEFTSELDVQIRHNKELTNELDAQIRRNKELATKLEEQKQQSAQLEKHLNNLRQCKTMKVGRAVLWPLNFVRKIRKRITTTPSEIETYTTEKKALAPSKPKASHASLQAKVFDIESLEKWVFQFGRAIAAMPSSNGCRFYEPSNLRIGIVSDRFFYESISSAAQFVPLYPYNWQEVFDSKGIDILLFVSAWHGMDEKESWRGLANLKSTVAGHAFALIDACKKAGIPVIFYSKEDPPNYKVFLEYAKRADCVFTSAVECISDYVEDCGHNRVYPLLFCINPLQHNPIGISRINQNRTVLFSGSWSRKYPDRCDALSGIFDGVLASDYDLHILDRNTGIANYAFPGRYLPYVSPSVDHQKLQNLHKLFDWAINVNSVTASETMFANRVYELQASGILLLSNYSVGVNTLHPNVFMVHEAMEVPYILGALTDEEMYEKKAAGIRSVYTGNTCFDRLADLLAGVGIEFSQPSRSVLVVVDKMTDFVREAVRRQTYDNVEVVTQSELTPELLDAYDMVTWFDGQAHYGEFYLEDLVNAFKYTASSYITKDAWLDGDTLHEGVEHNYVDSMNSRYRTLFWRSSFDSDFFLNPPKGSLPLPGGYAIDHLSYNAQAELSKPQREKPYKLSVVVPVYNNGQYLQGKCFPSLRRSTMFEDMEIVIVDDGSTDDYTLKIVNHLEYTYPNVVVYRYGDGGSGSASRPRNKGVKLASADYVTFLDPDNEAICDGYAYLYNEAQKNNLDITFGNIYTCGRETRLLDYHRLWKTAAVKAKGKFNFAKYGSLPALSIQAMVIRRAFLLEKDLVQVEGAAGQDTLFSWQLMDATDAVCAYPLPIHVYYAQTAGSVTNTVKPIFFEKIMRLQDPKIQWLRDSNLMSIFMDKRYVSYTRGVLFSKFAIAEEKDKCIRLIADYLADYEPYYDRRDDVINRVADFCAQGEYDLACDVIAESVGPVSTRVDVNPFTRTVGVRKTSIFDVEYQVRGASITFVNKSVTSESDKFSWVVRKAEKKWNAIYTDPYRTSLPFTYDFSQLAPGLYLVTAFRQKKGFAKERSDIMRLTVHRDLTITIDQYATPANEIP